MLYEGSKGRIKDWSAPVAPYRSCFMLVVMLNAAIAPHAAGMKEEMLVVIPVVVTLIVICYLLGYFGSYAMLGPTQEMQITFTYASGMRNISLGMVLATTYFSPRLPSRGAGHYVPATGGNHHSCFIPPKTHSGGKLSKMITRQKEERP